MEIELYSKLQNPIDAIEKIGEFFSSSGMFGCEKREQGMVLAMACLAEKKSPLEIKRTYHLLGGELSMRSDAMLAQFRSAGGKHKVISRTADLASVELTGKDGDKVAFSFSWQEAQKEPFIWSNSKDRQGNQLPKKNWATPRARTQMLWARVISDAVRTIAPEIVSGVYTPEERDDDSGSAPSKPLLAPLTVVASEPVTLVPATETAPVAPVAAAAPAVFQATLTAPGRLSVETVQALETAIGEADAAAALEWLKKAGWIKDNLSQLSVKRAQKILNNPQGFLATVRSAGSAAQAPAEASK